MPADCATRVCRAAAAKTGALVEEAVMSEQMFDCTQLEPAVPDRR
jgi:hypothetical protein